MCSEIKKKAYSPLEFAEAYGICETVARKWISQEDFPKVVFGRRIIIPIEEVEAYMRNMMNKQTD